MVGRAGVISDLGGLGDGEQEEPSLVLCGIVDIGRLMSAQEFVVVARLLSLFWKEVEEGEGRGECEVWRGQEVGTGRRA